MRGFEILMKLVGALCVVAALAVGSGLFVDMQRGTETFSQAEAKAEKAKGPVRKADILVGAAKKGFVLAPLIQDDRHHRMESDLIDCHNANVAYRKLKKARSTDVSEVEQAKSRLEDRCSWAAATARYGVQKLPERTAIMGVWLALAALGGVLALFGNGRFGGLLMMVGGGAAIAMSNAAAPLTGGFIALGVVTFILGAIVVSKRNKEARERVANRVAQTAGRPRDNAVRVVVQWDMSWSIIERALTGFGLHSKPNAMVTPPLIPGEPELAAMLDASGNQKIVYTFNPVVRYRELAIYGGFPTEAAIAAVLPLTGRQEVRTDLAGTDEVRQMRALMTADNRGWVEFLPEARRLARSPSRHVSGLAAQVAERLANAPKQPPAPTLAPTPTPQPAPSTSGRGPTQLVPRSMAEKALYMELTPCPSCGSTPFERSHALVQRGNDLVAVDQGPCSTCRTHREFAFVLPDDPLPAGSATEGYGGPEPSRIIDPGQWLSLSDLYARAPLAEPSALDAAGRQRAWETLRKAIVAMEEAQKFCGPDGMDEPPEHAFWSEESARMKAELPGQFRRFRLEARLGAYRGLAEKYRM